MTWRAAVTLLLVTVTSAVTTGCPEDPAPAALPTLPPRVETSTLGPPRAARPVREAIVALTGEVRGEIEPCGCPTAPYGGFRRRARLLDSLRAEGLPVFVVDAGEMLVKGQDAIAVADRPERGRAILDLARSIGLDAWAPGPSDLIPGGLALLEGTGALSATWRDPSGQPVLPAATVIERDGLRLGVVGLGARPRDLDDTDAVEAVTAATRGEADAWVVLSNASPQTTRAVAERVPGLGAVLSVRGEAHDPPRRTAGAPVIETPDRGRFVTVLRVALGAEPGPWEVVEDGVWEDVARVRARAGQLPTEEARAAARAKIAEAKARLDAETAGHDVVLVEDRPLGTDLDGEAVVDARIAAFKAQATRAAGERVRTAPERGGYVGSNACWDCHDDEARAWVFTDHARALESLVARGASQDPECVACHTTGWGEPGGFAELTPKALASWKAVQCEACHGPLAGHVDARTKPAPVTEQTCLRCHDAANSPGFDYAAYRSRVSCVWVAREKAAKAAKAAGRP